MMAEVEGNTSQVHSLIEIRKTQGSPKKGPFSITTYVRVRAQTNVNGTANENSSSFENSHEIMRKGAIENNMQMSLPKSISVSGSLSPQLGMSSTNLKVLQRQLSAHS
jgi:hypothetical protein